MLGRGHISHLVKCIISLKKPSQLLRIMVAYFCHHLSDNDADLSDLYVDWSVIYVDLSDHVDLSEKKSPQLVT